MEGFAPKELETLLRAMFAVAWADRVLQDEERALLHAFIATCKLSPSLRRSVKRWFDHPVGIDGIDWSALGQEARVFVYMGAFRVAQADNRVVQDEIVVLRRMADAMGLSKETIAAVHANAPLPQGHWLEEVFRPAKGRTRQGASRRSGPTRRTARP